MVLQLIRKWKRDTYTIGKLIVDGVPFCETCEDKDRGLKIADGLQEIKKRKVYGETAIPWGTYVVRMDVVSPKYAARDWYAKNCNGGRMPRIMDVPGWEGVLIHPGNSALDSLGCVLVGRNKVKGGLTQSKETFRALYGKMRKAYERGERITLEIYGE